MKNVVKYIAVANLSKRIQLLLIAFVLFLGNIGAQPYTVSGTNNLTGLSAVTACGTNYTFSFSQNSYNLANMYIYDNGVAFSSGWGTYSSCTYLNWAAGQVGSGLGTYSVNTNLYVVICPSPKTITFSTSAPTCSLTPPTLTAAGSVTVDAAFNVTFTDNSAWRAAITSITVGGTTLTSGYSVSAGQITFTPSASNPASLLQSNGSKSIVVIATGYTNATVTQPIAVGTATKLAMSIQPAAPSTNATVLGTQPVVLIQDQYGNATTSTANVTAAVGAGSWTIGGTNPKAGVGGTVTFTDITATSASSVTGATITFTSAGLTSVTSSTFNIPAPPAITLASASQVSAGNISQSSTQNALSAFTFAVTTSNAQISSLVFTTSGTYTASDVAKFQLWYNSSNSLGSAVQIGTDITSSLGTGTHTFSGLSQTITAGTTGYFWITTDVPGAATVSHTITVSSIATGDVTFLAGSKSGSATAGGTQTIQAPVSTVALASPSQTAAGYVGVSWTNTDICAFTLATTVANTTLTQVDFTTTGTVVDADLTNFKLWYNSSNTLNGATQLGSSITSSKGAGSHSFTSLGHTLTSGTTEYYWITIDVAGGATNAHTVICSAFTTSNITLSAGNKSGSTTAGGTQTIATPVTYYSRASTAWSTVSTWSTVGYGGTAASYAPSDVDIVNIGNTYTVSLTGTQICTNLTIDAGGTLADGGNTLQLLGNFTNNGTYSGTGKISLVNGHAEHQISSTNDNSNYQIELNDIWGAVITNQASSIKTTTITNLVLTAGIFRIGDFNNAAVYNKLTFSNAFTVSSGTTFKLDGNCSGNITFNDNVTIASGGTWTGTAGKTCSSLNFPTSNKSFTNNSTAQTDNSNSTYIFGSSQTLAGGSGMSIYNINCSSDFYFTQMTGTWTIRNNGTFNQAAQTNSGDLYLNGTYTFSGNWWNCTSSFRLHITGSQSLPYPGAAWGCVMIFDGTTTFSANQYFRTSVIVNGTLDAGTYLFDDGSGQKNSSTNVTNNGTIKFGGATTGFSTPTGTVEYNGTGAQTVYAGSYNNLIISGARSSNTITLDNSGNINIAGTFTPSASACTWTTTGTTIVFNGTTAQSIANAFTFNNLTINNTSSTGVTLNAAENVAGALTLTDGYVYTTSSNILTINSGATSSSGSDASHVEGPMQKIGSTAFNFPVGKSGVWAMIGFTPSSGFDATTEISTEYFKSASPNYNNRGTGIHNVSKIEYWDITRVTDPGNDASCNVTLYVNNKTRSGISGTGTDLTTVHYESTAWTNKGGTFHDNGDGTGYITSTTPLTSYSPEGLGSTSGGSTLPIELTNFDVVVQKEVANISWTTATETNNDYFTIERSTDGVNWVTIYTCDGAGTSTEKHNYFCDIESLPGTSYFRLKQTDINGNFTYSDIVSTSNANKTAFSKITVFPNPFDGKSLNISGLKDLVTTVMIFNANGSQVYATTIQLDGDMTVVLDLDKKLIAGVYVIKCVSSSQIYTQQLIVK